MTILKSLSSLDILVTDDLNIHVSYGFSYICVFLTLSGPSLPADVLWGSFVIQNEPQRTSAGRLEWSLLTEN